MFTTIVVPVDGSEPSDAAVKLSLRIAGQSQASVTFVHAVEVTKIAAFAGTAPMDPLFAIEAVRKCAADFLAEAKKQADRAKVQATTELLEGECVSSVLKVAKQCKADLIVVGSHGRRGISRAILGSVAEGILRRSQTPVLVCHAERHVQQPKHETILQHEVHVAERTIV